MSKFSQSWAAKWFYVFLLMTLAVYILRGLTVLSMLPGYVIWVLFLFTVITGILGVLESLR